MNGQQAFVEAAATPEQILAIFQDWQRLKWGECDKRHLLTFGTTVREWRDDGDLVDWQPLGKGLNQFFGTTFSKDEWRMVMQPEKLKTLRDVCALIATQASLPKVRPLKIFGKPCHTAPSFFALRFYLRRGGLEVAQLRPSTTLDRYLRLHTQTIIEVITKFAPGKLPPMKVRFNRGHRLSAWACFAGLAALIAGGILEQSEWIVAGCLIAGLGFVTLTVFSNLPPASVRLEGMQTFGDICRLIAGSNLN